MRKIEQTIYKFNELGKDIQEELINNEKETNRDEYIHWYLHDDMGSKASDLINDCFGIESDYLYTYYDLSYCQGSGAMVEFDINIEDLNNKYKVFTNEEIRFLTDKGIVNNIEVRHNNSNYNHEYTFEVDYHYYGLGVDFEDIKGEYDITEDEFNNLENKIDSLLYDGNKHYNESPFVKDIISMNEELTRYGYNIIENCEMDVDSIIGTLSECEYYIDGSVYKESEEI